MSLGAVRARPHVAVTLEEELDLYPMTFMYELDPYSLEICRMFKYELPTSRLSKVIV